MMIVMAIKHHDNDDEMMMNIFKNTRTRIMIRIRISMRMIIIIMRLRIKFMPYLHNSFHLWQMINSYYTYSFANHHFQPFKIFGKIDFFKPPKI